MQPPQQHSRINLAELKAQLVSKLGPEGSKQYFYYLNRLLSLKLSKFEFDKLCLRIIGRENIALHNQFIRSILKNACSATVPPLNNDDGVLKSTRVVEHRGPSSDECQKDESHHALCQAPFPPPLSNGDILPVSPRKARTGTRERRGGDRCSALGPSVKTNIALPQSNIPSGEFNVLYENGDSTPSDIRSVVQHHQELMQNIEHGQEALGHCPTQLLENTKSSDGPVSVHSTDKTALLVREDGKELSARNLLSAPLGVPFCHASVGGACRGYPLASSSRFASSFDSDGLLDTATLRERMGQIAATQGLEEVSLHCANVLNNALDGYLKGLIRSCIELVGARSGREPLNRSTHKNETCRKLLNGVRRGYHYQIQSSNRSLEGKQESGRHCLISLLDFRVAMELNQQQLGEDWPLLLEKICTHAFQE